MLTIKNAIKEIRTFNRKMQIKRDCLVARLLIRLL